MRTKSQIRNIYGLILSLPLVILTLNRVQGQSADHNFVLSRTVRVPNITTDIQLTKSSSDTSQVSSTIQYLDGLGRPLQTIQAQGSPGGNDVIQLVAYDAFGRQSVKYLPYTAVTSTPGMYRPAAASEEQSFYDPVGTGSSVTQLPGNYAHIPNAWSQTGFEASPLNRVLEQGAPGTPWQLSTSGISGAGHTKKIVYTFNTNYAITDTMINYPAALYRVKINADQSRTLSRGAGALGYYGASQLNVTVSKDENWKSGRAGTTEEYIDKEGHVVLKRTYNYNGKLQVLSTYYVYDDLNNLAFVLSPLANADAVLPSQSLLDNLCYQYQYDNRNRLTEKKIPGKVWDYIVYNKLDQVVAIQDGNMRRNKQWLCTKYDAVGRVIMTCLWNNGVVAITPAALQDTVNAYSDMWETRSGSSNYSSIAFPRSAITQITVNYYDNYTFPGNPYNSTLAGTLTNPTGLLTGSQIVNLNGLGGSIGSLLWTTHYYDERGRVVQTYQQHFLGAIQSVGNYDRVTNSYDFTNELTASVRQHYAAGTLALTVVNNYTYDHMGRKITATEQINNDAAVLLSKVDYNELGQLMTKHLHQENAGAPFLQDVAYTYNERGWLTSINDPTVGLTTSKMFAMQLTYNTGSTPQFNGNISSQQWNSYQDTPQTFSYTYDPLNRLTNGISGTMSETGITYDLNGNILSLKRDNNTPYVYTSVANTNQVQSISGLTTSNYVYDVCGNVLTDGRTGVSINYNMLNLPRIISKTGLNMAYTYSATGEKLMKISGTTTTYYILGIQYDNLSGTNAINFIQTEEGRAVRRTDGTYRYEYDLIDHLGNTRLTLSKDPNVGIAYKEQADNYYPFGLRYNTLAGANHYLYNGKELQEETGVYDYGARFYDPVIGRMTSIDRFSEQYMGNSPYGYGANNPISNIDMNGDSVIVGASITGNKVLNKAFNDFAGTKSGRKFLSNYAAKGQTINGYTFTADGKYNDKGIDLNYGAKNLNDNTIGGQTDQSIGQNGRAEIDVTLNTQFSPLSHSFADETFDKSMAIAHESFLHVDLDTKDFLDNGKFDNSNIDRSIINTPGMTPNHYQHIQVLNDYIKRGYYPGSSWPLEGYKTMQEINQKNNAGRTPGQIMQKLWNYSGGVQLDLNGKSQ